MAVLMGPERILPSNEDEDERPSDGAQIPVTVWEEGEGGEMELDGEEEQEEEENNGSYLYQPLNQEPDGINGMAPEEEEERGEVPPHTQQLQQVQQRIEVMGLHLPQAPPPDSDEEDDPEGAAAARSHASIPMDAGQTSTFLFSHLQYMSTSKVDTFIPDHVELVKRTMAAVALPSLGVPTWAQEISEDQWKDVVQRALQSRQNATGLRLNRLNNMN